MSTTEHLDPTDLADQLRAILDRLDAGDLTANPVQRARLEGAITACEVLAGESAEAITERLVALVSTTT